MSGQITAKSLTEVITEDKLPSRLKEVLGDRIQAFLTSLTLIARLNKMEDCEPRSFLYAGLTATLLGLELDSQFGQAYIIPFNVYNKKTKTSEKKAQLQIGYKGFYNLAMRSGVIKQLSVICLTQSQFKFFDPFTEKITYDLTDLSNKAPYCYACYMELSNGFRKTTVTTVLDLQKHADTYSKGFNLKNEKGEYTSKWRTDFNAMAEKTVIKSMLKRWALINSDLVLASKADHAVITGEDRFEYLDNPSFGGVGEDSTKEAPNSIGEKDYKGLDMSLLKEELKA